MKIRPYNKKDFRYIQDICMATSAFADDDSPVNRAYLCTLYCDCYLDNQDEFCFVAADDDDIPVGYILCSADCDDYLIKMDELYLPLVRKVNSGEFFKFNAMNKVTQRYIRQGYTAHFHIDILEEYRHQGLGTQLMQTLCDKLKQNNVEGVHSVCGIKNSAAKSFFAKFGFEDIDYISGAVVYGKKFFQE